MSKVEIVENFFIAIKLALSVLVISLLIEKTTVAKVEIVEIIEILFNAIKIALTGIIITWLIEKSYSDYLKLKK